MRGRDRELLAKLISEVMPLPDLFRSQLNCIERDVWNAVVPLGSVYTIAVGHIVKAADEQGWLRELLVQLSAAYPGRPEFGEFLRLLEAPNEDPTTTDHSGKPTVSNPNPEVTPHARHDRTVEGEKDLKAPTVQPTTTDGKLDKVSVDNTNQARKTLLAISGAAFAAVVVAVAILYLRAGSAEHTRKAPVTITVVGTNDLHGAIGRLPLLGGYLTILRAARATDGGVLLIDAGDMFRGTFESQFDQGTTVIAAYNELGYSAAAIGNHDFDFGAGSGSDARAVLKARASEARFPLLAANLLVTGTGEHATWPNVSGTAIVSVRGVSIGIIGVLTEATPLTTAVENFTGLAVEKPAIAIVREAKGLRAKGAELIVVAAHIGSMCTNTDDPNDISSCNTAEELFETLKGVPPGLIDVIVAGHTHAAVAHNINGTAVIESFSSGLAFGRIDITVSPSGRITAKTIFPPRRLCPADVTDDHECALQAGDYEGKPVTVDPSVAALVERATSATREIMERPIGAAVLQDFPREYAAESATGNFVVDLMLAARPDADVALLTAGSIRSGLPKGDLTFASLLSVLPFDDRFALIQIATGDLRKIIVDNLESVGAVVIIAGVTVVAQCKSGRLAVELLGRDNKPITEDKDIIIVTTAFIASGGGGLILKARRPVIYLTKDVFRDAIWERLKSRFVPSADLAPFSDPDRLKGSLLPTDFHDPKRPRLKYAGSRPIKCK
jgi:2',3'-cyclic-nucleotide 2'-phosphodiesterase (5'-nucleotidase family)